VRPLRRVQSLWSAEDPRRRTLGFLCKLAFEGGVSFVVVAVLGAGLYAVEAVLASITLASPVLLSGGFFAVFAWIADRAFCTLIPDTTTTDGGETGVEGATTDTERD
jgi:hypothetical protein